MARPALFCLLGTLALAHAQIAPDEEAAPSGLARTSVRHGHPRIGEPAPPLNIETIFPSQPLDGLSWEDLRGKAVVLEFWATWCAGCVAAIPHLNGLAAKFADQPVVFFSITREKQDKVARFLKSHRISGWVGSNPSRSQLDAYGVVGIPLTVLVDGTGTIQGITGPRQVTEAVLNDLLAGKELHVSR